MMINISRVAGVNTIVDLHTELEKLCGILYGEKWTSWADTISLPINTLSQIYCLTDLVLFGHVSTSR